MRFSTFFSASLLAFFAIPAILARPMTSEQSLITRHIDHEMALQARELEFILSDMIQERSLAGEDTSDLEARFFFLKAITKIASKGLSKIGKKKGSSAAKKVASNSNNNNNNNNNGK